mmetsp:Transcript_60075/g.141411  ORF Transcript_60075/g.141411 Transcript_60075/m.141411 type:complete len:211 (-) Transcript_60075:24-656(-)
MTPRRRLVRGTVRSHSLLAPAGIEVAAELPSLWAGLAAEQRGWSAAAERQLQIRWSCTAFAAGAAEPGWSASSAGVAAQRWSASASASEAAAQRWFASASAAEEEPSASEAASSAGAGPSASSEGAGPSEAAASGSSTSWEEDPWVGHPSEDPCPLACPSEGRPSSEDRPSWEGARSWWERRRHRRHLSRCLTGRLRTHRGHSCHFPPKT